MKVNCAHSPLNIRILSSTSVPFTPSTVQVPNLALSHKKWIIECIGSKVDILNPLTSSWVELPLPNAVMDKSPGLIPDEGNRLLF
jgi:hypothetical protein